MWGETAQQLPAILGFKFSVLNFGGAERSFETGDFTFFARRVEDLADADRHIALSNADLKLMNPIIYRRNRDVPSPQGGAVV